MKRTLSFCLLLLMLILSHSISFAKELPKIAVWDLTSGDIEGAYAQDLTLILGSEVSKLGKYEVYSQENVRTLAGWEAQKMMLGSTDTKCLTALGQMDIAKLISGRVGKIGDRFSVSLSLFDTQNAKAERMISEFCRSENELIELVQVAVRKLLGVEVAEGKVPKKAKPPLPPPLAGKPFTDQVTGMELIFIKGGCFEMGDTFGDGYKDEKPVHKVCVDDYYLGKYEVTQEQWVRVMGTNPSSFKKRGNYPVEKVTWPDTQTFLSRLNTITGRQYRLPTEAEWEYASRSGGKGEKYSGTSKAEDLDEYAWNSGNAGRKTHPVGLKKANGLGLYDMSGNVWEWCADWYDNDYYKFSPKNNPQGPSTGTHKLVRGGSWDNIRMGVYRAAYRGREKLSTDNNNLGFRVALSAR